MDYWRRDGLEMSPKASEIEGVQGETFQPARSCRLIQHTQT